METAVYRERLHAKNLSQLIRRIRQDCNCPNLPVVSQRIRSSNTDDKPYLSVVRQAHEGCKEENYRWIDGDDLERGPDNVHYTTKGYVELGCRCAGGMLELLQKAK